MRVLAGAVRRVSLRAWWPELLAAAVLAAAGLAGQKDDPLFAVFEGIVAGIFWAMGFRHRHLPLGRVIRDTHDGMSRIEDQLKASVPQEGTARPPLAVVRQFRRG